MKLNQDCIRDLMLYLEDNLTLSNSIEINCYTNKSFLEKYSVDDLRYTVLRLVEAGYLNVTINQFIDTSIPYIDIKSITFSGHKFLDTIRDDKVWTKTKSILSSFKSVSIELVSETAAKVITSLINQQTNP